jgi:hypothetical protein
MSGNVIVMPAAKADNRWRDWQDRGAASDRRSHATMRTLAVLIGTALVIWLFVQIA